MTTVIADVLQLKQHGVHKYLYIPDVIWCTSCEELGLMPGWCSSYVFCTPYHPKSNCAWEQAPGMQATGNQCGHAARIRVHAACCFDAILAICACTYRLIKQQKVTQQNLQKHRNQAEGWGPLLLSQMAAC